MYFGSILTVLHFGVLHCILVCFASFGVTHGYIYVYFGIFHGQQSHILVFFSATEAVISWIPVYFGVF